MKTIITYITLIAILFSIKPSLAQEELKENTKKLVLVKKSNGTEYMGEIISDNGREILIITKNIGKIYIKKSNIISITETNEVEKNEMETNSEFRAVGPFTTRYYFTNNALPIKKGENYALINLFGPEVHFTVSDNLSLGVITSWVGSPITLVSKLSVFSKNNVHISIGNLIGSSGYLAQGQIFGGLHWGTFSVGDRMKNISFSAGYGYYNDRSYTFNIPSEDALFLGLGGISPVGKKASFILDAMLIANKVDNPYYGNTTIYGELQNTTDPSVNNTTLIMMPGMRFYSSYTKAFQISLAGVFFKDNLQNTEIWDSNSGNYRFKKGRVVSFPVPTVSWLRKF